MALPRAKKSLGQHFLHDQSIAARIVNLLQITPEDQILEIGPGRGALTRLLAAARPQKLVLVEKDSFWAERCREMTASCLLEIQNADALKFPWESLSGRWKIIGNLPYNIASPLVWDIVSRTADCAKAVFMLQKEVAERVCATLGGKKYGALSVWVQSYAQANLEFAVLPGAFTPPPKVDSAVISLLPLPAEKRPTQPASLAAALKFAFQYRRKQMQSILHRAGIADAVTLLHSLNISPEARPETLSPELFQKFAISLAFS